MIHEFQIQRSLKIVKCLFILLVDLTNHFNYAVPQTFKITSSVHKPNKTTWFFSLFCRKSYS